MHNRASQTLADGGRDPDHAAVLRHPRLDSHRRRLRPADFHTFLDRFYRLASDSIVAHDGIVDKIVGDEVIGLFFGGISGPNHAAVAVAAAIDLAQGAARATTTSPMSIPVGTAVHTGEAFVGATGLGTTVDDFRRSVMPSTSPRDWHRLRPQAR
jgi:class 3 adenylate cyclase